MVVGTPQPHKLIWSCNPPLRTSKSNHFLVLIFYHIIIRAIRRTWKIFANYWQSSVPTFFPIYLYPMYALWYKVYTQTLPKHRVGCSNERVTPMPLTHRTYISSPQVLPLDVFCQNTTTTTTTTAVLIVVITPNTTASSSVFSSFWVASFVLAVSKLCCYLCLDTNLVIKPFCRSLPNPALSLFPVYLLLILFQIPCSLTGLTYKKNT